MRWHGLLRHSKAAALRWDDLEFHADGSGLLHVARPKTDQVTEGTVSFLRPGVVEALLAIRPQEAVNDPGASVFRLSASQISRRIKAAAKMAGLSEGVQRPLSLGRDGPGSERCGGGTPGADDRGQGGVARYCRGGLSTGQRGWTR